ncbi:hypothetical protein NB037_09605 [Rathayibacter sp. ZW T2_19]|uniref:Uncharacterized protein n=1 Tax=Rathayibacter rubneri TaxID=2950106 RepID=A0A9X2DXX8_9MICO|nr:hypothetical protein [Rathayibacter rubneri]MCM6762669.1 hypothetical protein [Rathayibacter rubneri]
MFSHHVILASSASSAAAGLLLPALCFAIFALSALWVFLLRRAVRKRREARTRRAIDIQVQAMREFRDDGRK